MDIYEDLMRRFGRRMACLVTSAVQLVGEHRGRQITKFYPGFIISVGGQWLFVTAGHSIQDLDAALAAGAIKIVVSRFMDCFSPDAQHRSTASNSFPFDYEGSTRAGFFFDADDTLGQLDGRDFGFIKIDEASKRLFEANGICPLDESLWMPPEGTILDEHVLVGIPDELNEPTKGATTTTFQPENVCIVLKSPSRPVDELDTARHRRIVKELPDQCDLTSVEGMSGGPMFAIGDGPEGEGRIWVVGIQSKQKGKVVFANPFADVVRYINDAINDHSKSETTDTEHPTDSAEKTD